MAHSTAKRGTPETPLMDLRVNWEIAGMRIDRISPGYLWTALWFFLTATAIATRPVIPVDESRYLGVAWEMWQRGDFLVPHLNGAPYSHKPPLLFWAIHAGWWFFGVSEWWARTVPPLFGLANLFLTAALGRRLWDRATPEAATAPVILTGLFLWTLFTTTLTFDMLVVFFTLVALNGVLRARRRDGLGGWLLIASGIGLGLLAKGPVLLLFVLPPALLAPWWDREPGSRARGWRWYWPLAAAVAAGVAIALAWVLPAAAHGGEEFRRAILFDQTTRRLSTGTIHPEPWWWYAALLPVILFPFSLWPALWRSLGRLVRRPADAGTRFCLAWALPALLALSTISSKQPHYLLPLFPALALLAARALAPLPSGMRLGRLALPLAGLMLLGLALASLPFVVRAEGKLPDWLFGLGAGPGLLLVALAAGALLAHRRRVQPTLILTLLSLALFTSIHLGLASVSTPVYDPRPIANLLGYLQHEGHPIAHLGAYHGQYHFPGRLEQPLEVIAPRQAVAWLRRHPGGRVVGTTDAPIAAGLGEPELQEPYRGKEVAVWNGASLPP